jgi:aminocarboxymuconate-semialdehyde decarboxylase
MNTRRGFLRDVAGVTTGIACYACGMPHPSAQRYPRGPRREVSVGGQRARTIDVHCHCQVHEVLDVVRGTPLEKIVAAQTRGNQGFPVGAERVSDMDHDGIDIEALSINAFWYHAERDLARRIIDLQNQKLSEIVKANPERFTAYASVALQFPDLAAEQMETAIKTLGLRGVAIGGSVGDDELSARKFDPFWAKAEELQALVFIHPQADAKSIRARTSGSGALDATLANPWETTLALAHLIFEGTLDRFPRLKICAAHGGGFLLSYAARMDHGCFVFPKQCTVKIEKRPTEYLKDLYYDTIIFTPEGLRHLVAESAPGRFMLGTDYATPWSDDPVGLILDTPGLTDAERIAMLGGTAAELMHMNG